MSEKVLLNQYLDGAEPVTEAKVDTAKLEETKKPKLIQRIAKALKKLTETNKNGIFGQLTVNSAAMWLYAPQQYSEHLNKGAEKDKVVEAPKKEKKLPADSVKITWQEALMALYAPKEFSELKNKDVVTPELPKKEAKLPADSVKISANEAFCFLYAPRETSEILKAKGKDGR